MNDNLTKKIMGRVYAIYLLRKVWSLSGIKLVVSVFAIGELLAVVSWQHVFANMGKVGVGGLYTFFSSAVENTEVTVKASLLVIAFVLLSYAASLIRSSFSNKVAHQRV